MAYDVLFFSAHPDDTEFGTGGTFLKCSKLYKTANIILTRGESGTHGTPIMREEEARAAAAFAGADIEFLDFKDNFVEDTAENAFKIAAIIRKYRPKIVFAPYHTNIQTHHDLPSHPDHTALGRIVLKAARFARFKNAPLQGEPHLVKHVIYFINPAYTRPSFVVDVSDSVDAMQKLWSCHASQLNNLGGKIIDRLLSIRKRIGEPFGIAYAESFILEEPLKLSVEDIFRMSEQR
jgi:LmbE family N-acetylglucosaminyl deacetylase